MKRITIPLIISLLLVSCGKRDQNQMKKDIAQREANGIAKIKVDEGGAIYLNSKQTSLDGLNAELTRIKEVNGVVWYYRASDNSLAEASGEQVTRKIIEYKLPVKLCFRNDPCKKDFE